MLDMAPSCQSQRSSRVWIIHIFSILHYLCCGFIDLSTSTRLEVSLSEPDAGLFLHAVSSEYDLFSVDRHEHAFAMLQQRTAFTSVRAVYGDFAADAKVHRLRQRPPSNEGLVVDNLDISAHVVSQAIAVDRPTIQVLFHAAVAATSRGAGTRPRTTASTTSSIRVAAVNSTFAATDGKLCMTTHVVIGDNSPASGSRQLSAYCVLSARSNVCLAEVSVPSTWWLPDGTQTAQVFYSTFVLDQNGQCSVDFPNANRTLGISEELYVSAVTLTHGQLIYEELQEDQNVLVYVPQASFYPGSKFRVPVKLQAQSNLLIFVVKVKARHGVRVVGAEAKNSSAWRISLDLNHKLHGAMVTASVTDKKKVKRPDRVQEIFEWIFEVDEDASGEDRGRINLVLEYEVPGDRPETVRSIEKKIVARVEIQRDNTYAIVPVIKNTELINTAILTGRVQNHAMRIYSVSHTGRLSDITSQTTCHSGDEASLKVSETCNWVYLDGTETKGSSSVTVITKYGRHTKFLFFRVWVPELPLDVMLSDNLLSQVKGWKVPSQPPRTSRKSRGADFGILTNPGLLVSEEGGLRHDDLSASCEPRYQSAVIEVLASLATSDSTTPGHHGQYMVGGSDGGVKFYFTDLVVAQLRVVDGAVAAVDGNVVVGVGPGSTEIQVISRSGRVLGTAEVTVSSTEKVTVERLQVDIVSAVSISLQPDTTLPRTMSAHVHRHSQLNSKYQEAMLEITIQFDDGVSLPLHYVPSTDYFLDVDTLNNHVVGFGPTRAPDAPRVIALGPGKGELLKVALELADSCQRKKSRPLAVSYAYVAVDFVGASAKSAVDSEAELRAQNDAAHQGYDRRDMYRARDHGKPEGRDKGESAEKKRNDEDRPRKDGLVKQVSAAAPLGMSALEVGMYTLLGVFCVAVVVFALNCAVFASRYRRRRGKLTSVLRSDGKEPVDCAPDWVWIGRDTLQRNAIDTACTLALMPESDFNSGRNDVDGPTRHSSTSSCVGVSSNRNSYVSTYKGSECSVQIAAATGATPPADNNTNVFEDADGGDDDRFEGSAASLSRTDGKSSLGAGDSDSLLYAATSQRCARKNSFCSSMSREDRLKQLEEAVASGSDIEFDCEALGVTYDELIQYFDNLKESTA